ncbi:MAG: NAD(P)/FAD-dependent oxidoreductase [Eubacteriales bacterium]
MNNSVNTTENIRVAVIGGGAAGMAAAAFAAYAGAQVVLYEKNGAAKLGRKLGITGKGRCNITNDCTRDEFLENIPRNPRFLYAAYSAFPPSRVIEHFEYLGVPTKVERGRRVFPESDRAYDIVDALVRDLEYSGVTIIGGAVKAVTKENGIFTIHMTHAEKPRVFDRVIIATGGLSYPKTGSTGDGYAFARSLGHHPTATSPSLVPLTSSGKLCPSMQGLSLKNTALTVVERASGKKVYEDFGEMMFTHFGMTGPMVLSASARLEKVTPDKYEIRLDLKPALDEPTLDTRLLSDFSKYKNRDLANALCDLLPSKMIVPFIEATGIPRDTKVHSITKEMRRKLVETFKCFRVPVSGLRPITEAIITRGGIPTDEIDPRTMQSKLCEGLYFAGEIIDVDAYTGGYNLQIAWSTAFLAGNAAAKR